MIRMERICIGMHFVKEGENCRGIIGLDCSRPEGQVRAIDVSWLELHIS